MTKKASSPSGRLLGLSLFLPKFENPDFVFGRWQQPIEREPGVITLPFFIMSEAGYGFVEAAYDLGWVQRDFDWVAWKETEEAIMLRDNDQALAEATSDQLAHLLTVLIRQERFCEGSLDLAYRSGLLNGILRRASELASELEDG